MIFGNKSKPDPAERMHANLPLIRPSASPRRFEGMLFICGLHRSGTTLAEALFQAHFDMATLRADVPENEGQHLQDVYPPAFAHGGAGRFAFAPDMHAGAPDPETAARARRRLIECWSGWATEDGCWLVEKSPPNLTRIGWLRAVFPGARFLVISRDPRAVAAATRKWSGSSPAELVYHWHVAYSAALRAMGPDCHLVRYEDLCAGAAKAIETAGDRLGLPKRHRARPLPERFRVIENSNRRYLAGFPAMRFGRGAWQQFGYDDLPE